MNLETVISEGRADRSKLEKFADGCTFLARAFWLGRSVSCQEDTEKYTVQIRDLNRNVTRAWMDIARSSFGIYPFGIVISPIVFLAYAITCIPVAIAMGVGLVAKKIALATDSNAKNYQAIVREGLALAEQESELKSLRSQFEVKDRELGGLIAEQKSEEEARVVGNSPTAVSLRETLRAKISEIRQSIESARLEIERLRSQIEQSKPREKLLEERVRAVVKRFALGRGTQAPNITIQV